ncbi:hypothetical protein GQ44DRAFT_695530 [Phaeosphaeriaceae sp. PMI808]|nr:hypothetical protein GQ44DRAFT_695530 [Phaeosphaeriaceae sp. PMI808]
MENLDINALKALPQEYLAEDRGQDLFRVSVAFIVLETFFIILFLIARVMNKTAKSVEVMYLMPAGYVFCVSVATVGILMVMNGGAGRHIEYLLLTDPNVIIYRTKLDKVLEYTYLTSVLFPKLSIVCLYLRIFSDSGRFYRFTAYTTAGIITATWVAGIFLASFICVPFAYYWDRQIPGGKCGNQMLAYRVISIPNAVTDLILLILPLPVLYTLHVKLPVKIGIFLTFLTGSVGILTSILRTVNFFTIDFFVDPTYLATQTTIWTITEPGVYLIAACMPTLRPLKRIIFKDMSFTSMFTSLVEKIFSRTPLGKSSRSSAPHFESAVFFDTKLRRVKMKSGEHGSNTSSTANKDHSSSREFVEV